MTHITDLMYATLLGRGHNGNKGLDTCFWQVGDSHTGELLAETVIESLDWQPIVIDLSKVNLEDLKSQLRLAQGDKKALVFTNSQSIQLETKDYLLKLLEDKNLEILELHQTPFLFFAQNSSQENFSLHDLDNFLIQLNMPSLEEMKASTSKVHPTSLEIETLNDDDAWDQMHAMATTDIYEFLKEQDQEAVKEVKLGSYVNKAEGRPTISNYDLAIRAQAVCDFFDINSHDLLVGCLGAAKTLDLEEYVQTPKHLRNELNEQKRRSALLTPPDNEEDAIRLFKQRKDFRANLDEVVVESNARLEAYQRLNGTLALLNRTNQTEIDALLDQKLAEIKVSKEIPQSVQARRRKESLNHLEAFLGKRSRGAKSVDQILDEMNAKKEKPGALKDGSSELI